MTISYSIFILTLMLVVAGLSWLGVTWLYRRGDRKTSFVTIISIALLAVSLLLTEAILRWVAKPYTVTNPTFVWAGNWQTTRHPNLPYLRKSNFQWEGISHGDLAQLNFDPDPYARHVTYLTDKDGFRNHKQIDKADIIVLGDSYTEASNVAEEEGYVYRLGEKMSRSVKNLAVSGYTTPHESIILGEYGLAVSPRVAILQIAESNDLPENEIYYNWVKSGNPPPEFEPLTLSRLNTWKRRSPSYRLYQTFFPLALNPFELQGTQTDAQGNTWLTRFFQPPIAKTRPEGSIGWFVMKGALLRMKEICQEKGIKLVVILIPDKINILRGHVVFEPKASRRLAEYPPIPSRESLASYLTGYCAELELSFIDMTQPLAEATQAGQIVYLPMDTHLSPVGHEVVANRLAKALIPFFEKKP